MSNYNLLGVGNNAKTIKGDGSEYLTAILYLAPFKSIDNFNVCPMAHIANCGNACLYTAGRGAMSNVKAGRIPVIDGDKDDLRFLDPNNKPHVVALYAKGQAKKDNTGFVINN
jgi:hypothetical protein